MTLPLDDAGRAAALVAVAVVAVARAGLGRLARLQDEEDDGQEGCGRRQRRQSPLQRPLPLAPGHFAVAVAVCCSWVCKR